jgi:hypothetical protein
MSLADFLPNTGSMGELISFLFTFIYSAPYVSFIPLAGVDQELPFTGSTGAVDMANRELVHYRRDLEAFMALYAEAYKVPGPPAQIHQWELSIET